MTDTDDRADTHHSTDGDSYDDRDRVLLQMRHLLIEDVAESDDRGAEHEVNHTAPLAEGLIGYLQCGEDEDQLDDRHQHRVQQRVQYRYLHPAVDLDIDEVEAYDERDREDLAVEEMLEHDYLRLLSI